MDGILFSCGWMSLMTAMGTALAFAIDEQFSTMDMKVESLHIQCGFSISAKQQPQSQPLANLQRRGGPTPALGIWEEVPS